MSSNSKLEAEGDSACLEWPVSRVRTAFVDFFGKNDHTFFASSPVVPHNDPTLLFTNAGMNQFKQIFLGVAPPGSKLSSLVRAANSQKCIRAGGKHNDLDDVGKDSYHHTFFEMLGNWSFGDYFKADAISMAFDLLCNVYNLPADRLYATYFGGDDSLGLPPDTETRDYWLNYFPSSRVLPFGCKDNFWEMGDTGPCGPCTELHFDRLGDRDASSLVNADDPTVIEIWNLVFIQFNREADGSLRPLPSKHVDTGMGLERVVSILQNKMSNYDTDVFSPIFSMVHKLTGCRPYSGKFEAEDADGVDMAYRVVADHIRTLSVAIADGAVPDSDGRGYVLRRILRRAVRYGRQFLNAPSDFFSSLTDSVVTSLGEAFPELVEKRDHIVDVIAQEEKTFLRTLDRGTERFAQIAADLKSKGSTVIAGSDAFFLYDTMGFPLDLTERMAEEIGLTVDTKEYHKEMDSAKAKSRADRANRFDLSGVRLVLEAEETAHLSSQHVNPTLDDGKYIWNHTPKAVVKAIFKGGRGGFVKSTCDINSSEGVGIILDSTSFYAEAGGQIADVGALLDSSQKEIFEVKDCQAFGGYILHIGKKVTDEADVSVGDTILCSVDYERRRNIAPNHTMTHALNFALRKVLGPHVEQKGSLVDASKLRFDFSHQSGMSMKEVEEVDAIVNELINEQVVVFTRVTPLVDAKRIPSLRAVFGETYPDPVRVVSIGAPVEDMLSNPSNKKWNEVSVEFCGGTHLTNTQQAEDFVIVEEGALSTGVRRITAFTKDAAVEARKVGSVLEEKLGKVENMKDSQLPEAVPILINEVNESVISTTLKQKLRERISVLSKRSSEALKMRSRGAMEEGLAAAEREVMSAKDSGLCFATVLVPLEGDGKALSKLTSKLGSMWPEGSIMTISVDHKKNSVKCCAVSSTSAANEWMSACMSEIGGRGGGKPTSANGTAPFKGDDQVEKLVEFSRRWKS